MKLLCAGERFAHPITHQECLACAKELRHATPCGFGYPTLKALFHGQEGDKRLDEIHVSDLTGCLLKAYLDKVDPQPIYPHDLLVAAIGIAWHSHVEAAMDDPDLQAEVTVSGAGNLVGRIDLIWDEDIWDTKTTRWLENRGIYGKNTEQVNIYRALANKTGRLFVNQIDVSGPPRCQDRKCPGYKQAMRKIDGLVQCPNCGYVDKRQHLGSLILEAQVYNPEQVRENIAERVGVLTTALANKVPPDPEPDFYCRFCPHVGCTSHPDHF